MKSSSGCALTNLTTYNHVPTALHIGFRNRQDIFAKTALFDVGIMPVNAAARGHGMIYNFGREEIVSNAFVETRKEVLIPFLDYCMREERLCSQYHHEEPRVTAQTELQKEIGACAPNSGMPAVVSTYRLFNQLDGRSGGSSYLCNLMDEQSLSQAVHSGMNKQLAATLHRLAQDQGETMYITHAIALRCVQYNPPDQAPVVMPENYDQQKSGWTIYTMGERMFAGGTIEGYAYPVSFNTGFQKTLRFLSEIEDAFILPKIDNRTYALNELDSTFHHERFKERAAQIDMAAWMPNNFGGQAASHYRLD
jgi:hypothetical protein